VSLKQASMVLCLNKALELAAICGMYLSNKFNKLRCYFKNNQTTAAFYGYYCGTLQLMFR